MKKEYEKHTEEERDGQAYQERGNEYKKGKVSWRLLQGRPGEVEETSRGTNSEYLWLDCLTTFLQWFGGWEAPLILSEKSTPDQTLQRNI